VSPSAGTVPSADEISLRVPATPASLVTVRLFAASIGDVFGLAEEEVQDLKLVLSELCAGAVGGSGSFDVAVTATDGRLLIVCRSAESADDPAADRRRGILEALIPDAVYGGDTVSFTFDR
jgi:anti-sigma regulatory factor (Ser/Thr protein kinase)